MCALAAMLAAGCGGGELPGQDAPVSSTQASVATTTTPATAQAPPATAPQRPANRRPARTKTTTTAPTTTATTPPATTQPPAATTPTTSTTATHKAPKPKPKPAVDPGRPIEETAQLTLVSKASSTEYTQSGTVTGTYDGQMTLTARITARGISVSFTVTADGGTVSGHGLAIVHITGAELEPITGTASIDSGTGRYAGLHGTGLTVKGRVALDASRGTVHLTGTVFG